MSQDEIVQAIKNLGNKAFLHELMDEYWKLHYTNPNVRHEQLEKSRYYTIKNAVHVYIMKAKKNGMIGTRRIFIPNTDKTRISKGLNRVEYYILNP